MRKLFIWTGFLSVIALVACNHSAHTHAEHGHDHRHETIHDHETVHTHNENAIHEHAGNHADEIIFTPQQAEKAGIRYYTVQTGDFRKIIETSGQILPAQGDEMTMTATVNGIITFGNIQLSEGKQVAKGDKLFYISSKNIAEGDYLARTKAAYEQAEAAYRRAQALIKDTIISRKELEQSKFEYETAKAAYEAVKGNSSERGTNLPSPLSGYIKNVLVREGDYVTAGQSVATLSQNRKLILQADVSQRYYDVLPSIVTANFRTPYDNKVYTLDTLKGKLLSYGKSTGNSAFYLPVNFEFDNRGNIIPGSFVTVYLVSAPLQNVIAIPESALTEEQGAYFVYVKIDEEGYEKREVLPGAGDGQNRQILSGLQPGETIVSEGAYQIKLASVSSVIPEGHSHNH